MSGPALDLSLQAKREEQRKATQCLESDAHVGKF